jgi:hypothetical protein
MKPNPTQAMLESAMAIDGPNGWFQQIVEAAGEIARERGASEEEAAEMCQLQAEMLTEVLPLLRALLAAHTAPECQTIH